MMVVAKKIEVSSYNLNFSTHSIEVVIVLIVLKLLILDFVQMQQIEQVFFAFTLMKIYCMMLEIILNKT